MMEDGLERGREIILTNGQIAYDVDNATFIGWTNTDIFFCTIDEPK